jgi:uncharacterized protein (TIGR02246 family)
MTKPGGQKTEGDMGTIQRVREAHIAALNAGDADAWVSLFTDDGVQMPPNAPAHVGRERVRAWSRAFLEAFRATFTLSVAEVRVTGEWAFERGAYRITLTPQAGGRPIQDVGKYITLYQRLPGGTWGIARDIWNTDHPLPGTGP